MCISISSTGKISYGWIRDLGFNSRLYQKPINVDDAVKITNEPHNSRMLETIPAQ